jgi:hypothetical protein
MALEIDPVTRVHLDRGVEGLVDDFRGVFSRQTIERYVQESLESLPAARFSDFVPVLVHRFARGRLKALAQAEGKIAKDVPEVSSSACRTPAGARWQLRFCTSERRGSFTSARREATPPSRSIPVSFGPCRSSGEKHRGGPGDPRRHRPPGHQAAEHALR